MSDVISEYQRWKQKGEDLRAKAKQAMEARFRDLLLEAVKIAEEFRVDFGGTLRPPPAITAFRYKAGVRGARKPTAVTKSARVAPSAKQPKVRPDPQVARLQKCLQTAKKKLELAKPAGEPTQSLEDKVHEIEDDLRIARDAQ